ncbi:MAG: hypothetical protein H0W61_13750 [Bacteroidetes bacterium]|nr:hypothetical protein [Bacteroidota bacterium]
MKSIIKMALVVILLASITTSCSKYQDGPKFSLLTKKARLTGDWKIDKVTYNGNDVTSFVVAGIGANAVLDIEKDGNYKQSGNDPDDGKWKFGEDKDDVYFTSNKAGSKEEAYRILRLKSKELWLRQTESNGDVTIIHYVPA